MREMPFLLDTYFVKKDHRNDTNKMLRNRRKCKRNFEIFFDNIR